MDLWPSAEWCLGMLSMVLDDMMGKGMLQEAIANRTLFLEGGVGSARKRVLQMSFIRRSFLSGNSVSLWLEAMLLKQGAPSKLAIDYFHLLSQATLADFVGPKRTPDEADMDAFPQ
jgi:hypothetical protein